MAEKRPDPSEFDETSKRTAQEPIHQEPKAPLLPENPETADYKFDDWALI